MEKTQQELSGVSMFEKPTAHAFNDPEPLLLSNAQNAATIKAKSEVSFNTDFTSPEINRF